VTFAAVANFGLLASLVLPKGEWANVTLPDESVYDPGLANCSSGSASSEPSFYVAAEPAGNAPQANDNVPESEFLSMLLDVPGESAPTAAVARDRLTVCVRSRPGSERVSEIIKAVADATPGASPKGGSKRESVMGRQGAEKELRDSAKTVPLIAPLILPVSPMPLPPLSLQLIAGQLQASIRGDERTKPAAPDPAAPTAPATTAFHARVIETKPEEQVAVSAGRVDVVSPIAKVQAQNTPTITKQIRNNAMEVAPVSSDVTPATMVPGAHASIAPFRDNLPAPAASESTPPPAHEPVRPVEVQEPEHLSVATASAQPVREVTLHVASDSQKVQVQVNEHGGELRVVVKSGDPVLTSDLRAGLSELVSGLEKSGFRADAWRPEDHTIHGPQPLKQQEMQQQPGGEDPRQQSRNSYLEEYIPRRRASAAHGEWINQMSAFISAER
jgi:hypothetical protein